MSEDNGDGNNGGDGSSGTPSFDGELITNAEGSEASDKGGSDSSNSDSE